MNLLSGWWRERRLQREIAERFAKPRAMYSIHIKFVEGSTPWQFVSLSGLVELNRISFYGNSIQIIYTTVVGEEIEGSIPLAKPCGGYSHERGRNP